MIHKTGKGIFSLAKNHAGLDNELIVMGTEKFPCYLNERLFYIFKPSETY
jgi:hypothetical protein